MGTIAETKAAAVGNPGHAPQRLPALCEAASFIARYKVRLALVSALVLIPCFWHQRIEAGDLSSHLYNAWLVQLIHQGKAPGLSLAPQWTNILFDLMVSRTAALFGFPVAEKICVSLAVLIFFWGAFAFVAAASRRVPWFLMPVLAMLAYGWTFNMGFFNFYLSLGLAFLSLAVVWRGCDFDFVLPILLLPLMWMAHPLGLVLFLALAAYIGLTRVLRPLHQLILLTAATGIAAGISRYVVSHYVVRWPNTPSFLVNGANQLALFNKTYYVLAVILALEAAAFILVEAVVSRERLRFLKDVSVPAQLYAVIWLTLFLLPNRIVLPQYGAPVDFLVTRTSLALGVVGCCLLAAIRPRMWHIATFAAIAVFFFGALFLDTGRMNEMEAQAEKLVATLPAGQRVVSTGIALPPSGWMVHLIDRACIGHCFMYSNYEPASLQFQVRTFPGNPFVAADSVTVQAMERGDYVVGERDLPLYVIGPCPANGLILCGRFLRAGERARIGPQQ